MPELMRLIAARLRHFVGDRRSAPRHETQLACRVSLMAKKGGANGMRRARVLVGQTRDLSTTGLGVIMPAIRIGEHYLTGEGRTLLVEIDLPDGTVQLQAVAVRYERLEQDEDLLGYLIGLRIADLREPDKSRFAAYVKKLKA
jgi:hypothetical protein